MVFVVQEVDLSYIAYFCTSIECLLVETMFQARPLLEQYFVVTADYDIIYMQNIFSRATSMTARRQTVALVPHAPPAILERL